MWRLVLRPQVEDERVDASPWYDTKQIGLGDQFLDEYIVAIDHILANPFLFSVAVSSFRVFCVFRDPSILASLFDISGRFDSVDSCRYMVSIRQYRSHETTEGRLPSVWLSQAIVRADGARLPLVTELKSQR